MKIQPAMKKVTQCQLKDLGQVEGESLSTGERRFGESLNVPSPITDSQDTRDVGGSVVA